MEKLKLQKNYIAMNYRGIKDILKWNNISRREWKDVK